MTIHCAIIDDEPLAAGLLKSYAEKTPFLHLVGTYGSALEAMKQDKTFYVNTINHTENYIHRYIIEQTQVLFQGAIDVLDEHRHVDSGQRAFIAKFFAYGVSGTVIEWASEGMVQAPEEIAKYMRDLQLRCEKAAYIYASEIFKS
jgi:hypothetical protein